MANGENNLEPLSVIIPCLNEEHYIGTLLSCLARQTFQDFEVLVVDGHSTDDTHGAVERAVAAHPSLAGKVRFIESPKKGPGAQRNFGASLASRERLVFFDADVQIRKTYLSASLRGILKRRLDMATTLFDPITPRLDDKVMYLGWNIYLLVRQFLVPNAIGFCIFSTREVQEATSGFDERINLGEDSEFIVRASRMGFSFRILFGEPILVSVRRLEKEGRFNFYRKCITAELLTYVKSRKEVSEATEYEFGNHLRPDEVNLSEK